MRLPYSTDKIQRPYQTRKENYRIFPVSPELSQKINYPCSGAGIRHYFHVRTKVINKRAINQGPTSTTKQNSYPVVGEAVRYEPSRGIRSDSGKCLFGVDNPYKQNKYARY